MFDKKAPQLPGSNTNPAGEILNATFVECAL